MAEKITRTTPVRAYPHPSDSRTNIPAVSAELHSDEEATLLDDGSHQADLWGINLYPADYGAEAWIEFDSMINVRPSQGNRSRRRWDAKNLIEALVSG